MSGIFSINTLIRSAAGLPRLFLAIPWLILLLRPAMADEIAIIPYRIENPSSDFSEKTGEEYARLLGVAAIVSREGVEVTPLRDVVLDLERMKLSPQGVITKDDLDLLGRTKRIDRFLLGSLTRREGAYRSESVLYSVRERRVIARARAGARDLFGLAERETREALAGYRARTPGRGEGGRPVDAAFILDASYRINRDWDAVKSAIIDFSADFIDARRADTRVYIIPFSDRADYASASVSENSIPSVRAALDRLKPAGWARAEDFMHALQYGVKNVRWRAAAAKAMLIITNSPAAPRAAEQLAVACRGRGIVIHALSLGGVPGDASELPERLARITGGTHRHAAYRQRLFTAGGDAIEVFFENGRLFRSSTAEPEWREGLYEAGSAGRPRRFLDEVFSRERAALSPYALPESFARMTAERLMNQGPLESNVGTILEHKAKGIGKVKAASRRPAGRALLTDGKVSFWVEAPDAAFMEFFEGMMKAGRFFPLGVTVRKDASSAYGIALVPLVRGLSADQVPDMLGAPLEDIVRRSDHYLSRGLFIPPVWFVSVKVGEAERSRRGEDVRGR